jgi:carboxyl-terminal processing protease
MPVTMGLLESMTFTIVKMGGLRSSTPPQPSRWRRPITVALSIIIASSPHRLDTHESRRASAAHGFVAVRSRRATPSSSSSSAPRVAVVVIAAAAPRVRAAPPDDMYPGRIGIGPGERSYGAVAAGRGGASSVGPRRGSLPSPLRAPLLAVVQALMIAAVLITPGVARASDYASFTPEQRFVAEAWRTVDNAYIDRTFNHQDWFKMRQVAVSKKYDNMDEARSEVESMLGSLGDRYTRYLPPAKYDSIVNAATGNLYGVGVELAPSKDGDRVIAADVEPTGPAMRGGLRPGDIFLEVDGVRFDDGRATPDDVALVVRGPQGSRVGVVVEREGKTVDFILTREPIKITSVRGYMGEKLGVPGKVGVVRIKNFSGTTSDTVRSEIEDLKKKGATSFVLDLRGNPGGLLPGGVDTASLFLDADRVVVYVVNKNGVVDSQRTLAEGVDLTSPLVLLVDGNTASAAEVMTAALKENKRAVVAGEKTFGKGIVQTIRQLEGADGEKYGGVAVTIARYETPEHHDINKQGIPVDVNASVDCGKEDALTCLPKEAFSIGKV